jgi:hypothetical protein
VQEVAIDRTGVDVGIASVDRARHDKLSNSAGRQRGSSQ